jgi:hypothetical protein
MDNKFKRLAQFQYQNENFEKNNLKEEINDKFEETDKLNICPHENIWCHSQIGIQMKFFKNVGYGYVRDSVTIPEQMPKAEFFKC